MRAFKFLKINPRVFFKNTHAYRSGLDNAPLYIYAHIYILGRLQFRFWARWLGDFVGVLEPEIESRNELATSLLKSSIFACKTTKQRQHPSQYHRLSSCIINQSKRYIHHIYLYHKMIQQAARCTHEQIHALLQLLRFGVSVGTANDTPKGLGVILEEFTCDPINLLLVLDG